LLEDAVNLDIKSNLYDSIGYLYLNVFYEFSEFDEQRNTIISKALGFYNEVRKESIESIGYCVKSHNIE